MKTPNNTYQMNYNLANNFDGGNTPSNPQRSDPFKKEEGDNDMTRIRPGIHEPEKNDPTKIDIPNMPPAPSPGEDQPGQKEFIQIF